MSVTGSDQARRALRLPQTVTARTIARVLGSALLASFALWNAPTGIPSASAAPCPDVEVVFARGTFEPPGVGGIGQAFIDELRAQPQLGGKSIEVYPVNYPASLNFSTAADGVIDAGNKVREIAANCPATKMVLGGYSQGAAVIGYLTADAMPVGYTPPPGITGPMPPETANHVAAVTLFGKPSNGFLNNIDRSAPPITVGTLYAGKTIDQCIPEDPICSTTGNDGGTHSAYAVNGMTAQAAAFAANSLVSPSGPSSPLQDFATRHS